MAVTKLNFLDENGVQKLAQDIFSNINTRIADRITTLTSGSYSDTTHVLSSKAILDLIGNINNYASLDGTGSTVLDKVKALDLVIGDSDDAATDDTVYGAIAAVRATISGLTHLTYEVVTGDIHTEVPASEAKEDVIYLQHDEDSYSVGNDGYLLDALGAHATYTTADAEPVTYEAYLDPSDGKIYKMVAGVKGAELASNDPIFENVAMVEDTTYTLYIAQLIKDGETVTGVDWIAVGDTTLELANYWSKSDADVVALRTAMFGTITDATITTKVAAAYAATDPFSS